MNQLLLAVETWITIASVFAKNDSKWNYWNPENVKIFEKLISDAKNDPEAYAVFDADNTIWQNDLEETFLPFLEMKKAISRDTIDPSLILIPFKEDESLYAYYNRLCEVQEKVCYSWIVQVFSGFQLQQLKPLLDELFAYTEPIPAKYWENDILQTKFLNAPKIYVAQRELIKNLQAGGIKVYIVSAAAEELVRMIASDPKYDLNFPPENVIGVNLLLRNDSNGALITSRNQIALNKFTYPQDEYMKLILTPYIVSPATFYVGKVAAILDYIDPVKPPILAAGDAPSDHYMLFYSTGYRIWVDRKAVYTKLTSAAMQTWKRKQEKLGVRATADRNWIFIAPSQLHGLGQTVGPWESWATQPSNPQLFRRVRRSKAQ